ncbi:MAG: secretin N-terminal domain-containing protein [Victivallaceae bacterium]|nr:secretin N-terminal domain-containing protein [Victivallaceae bacterium]
MKKWLMASTGALLAALCCASCSLDGMFDDKKDDAPVRIEDADRYTFVKRNRNESEVKSRDVGEEELPPAQDAIPLAKIDTPAQVAEVPGVKAVKPEPFYSELIALDADEELPVRISLNSAPLIDALPAFADILGFNFIADSEIKSAVTVNIDSVLTRRELWQTLDQLIDLAGCSAKLDGQIVNIIPAAKLGARSTLAAGTSGAPELVFRQLKNITAASAQELLQPFCSSGAVIKPAAAANALLIADTPANAAKLNEILDRIDTGKRAGWPRGVYRCDNVVPSTAAAELAALLPILGFTVDLTGGQSQEAGAVQLMGVDRLQMLVATAATQDALDEIARWIHILDTADNAQQERVYVYKVTNGKAEQLAQALSIVFNVSSGTSLTVDSADAIGSGSNTKNLANTGSANTTDGVDNLPNTLVDRSSSVFEVPVRLFADGVYNRLVIRTTPRCYAMVKALLDRLDTVPSQVLIQILLVEITLDDSTLFGVEFSYAGSGGGADSLLQTNYTELKPDEGAGEGFSYLITNPDDPSQKFGYLRAKAGKSRLKVISSPQVLVSSNSTATVQIGSDVPYQTGSISSSSSSGAITNSFQYRTTGIVLEIKPQVTSNDLISFEISQEISEAVKTTTSDIQSPTITVRKIESTMTIANGRSMILGGLIQEREKEALDTVPIISEIPLVNSLLGKTEKSIERTEVLMMITGYVINERSPVEDLLRRYNESVRSLNSFENKLEDEYQKDVAGLSAVRSGDTPVVIATAPETAAK